jgi:hypothetical protein
MHKFLPSSKILLRFISGTPILNCLPSTSRITPSLRSNLLVERLLSPYTNELLSWTDLRTLNRVPVRGNVPSWYTLLKDYLRICSHSSTRPFAIISSWFRSVTPDIILQTSVWILSQIPHRHISSSSFSFYIGKALTMTRNCSSVCFAHWIPNRSDDTIAPCPGCHLSSPYLRNNAFLTQTATPATCLFTVSPASCVGISCIPFNFVKKRTFTLKPSWNLLEASAMDYFSSQISGSSFISRSQPSSTNHFNYSPQVSIHHVSSTDNCFYFYIHGHYSSSPYAFRSSWTQIDSPDHQLLLSERTFNIGASFPSIQSAFLYALISIAEEVPATSIVNITFANKSFSRLSSQISDFVLLARELRCSRHITWRLFLDIIHTRFLTFQFTSLLTHADDLLLGRTRDRVINALPDDPFLPLNYGSISSLSLINSFSGILIDIDPQYFYKQLLRIHEIIVLSSLAATKYYFSSLISPLIQCSMANYLEWSSFRLCHRHVVYQRFKYQLFIDLLQVLSRFRRTNPNTYNSFLLCHNCLQTDETPSHLWTCKGRPSSWSHFDVTSNLLQTGHHWLGLKIKRLDKSFLPTDQWFTVLTCSNIFTVTSSPSSLNGIDLLKGWVPRSLADLILLHTSFSPLQVSLILNKLVAFLQYHAFHNLWFQHNEDFLTWKRSVNILTASKTTLPKSLSRAPNIGTSSLDSSSTCTGPSPPPVQVILSPTSPLLQSSPVYSTGISWLKQSITRGSHWTKYITSFLKCRIVQVQQYLLRLMMVD